MAVSIILYPNTGRYLPVDLANEPTVRGYEFIRLLAQQIPTPAADRTLDSSRPTKDMS
ncbi:hypothetical protein MCOO_35480 [Mycobacterium cookii]|uniref:Uncharacterized protein n=1 Tax=Mycobacterium cookii TaxID=1775 RepID=A0A7I7L068_9MYCO|nr:hypothetical protein MCOO_35480 [Mycobacterium cookii]